MTRILLVIAIVTAAAPARADDTETTLHKGQFGIGARFGLGYRGIAPYHNEYCGVLDPGGKNGNAAVCSARSPVTFDLEASFGVAQGIDITLELQFALEQD